MLTDFMLLDNFHMWIALRVDKNSDERNTHTHTHPEIYLNRNVNVNGMFRRALYGKVIYEGHSSSILKRLVFHVECDIAFMAGFSVSFFTRLYFSWWSGENR